jgi:hypothetical protein
MPLADLEQFVAKAIRLRSEIGARNIGHAPAVLLGLEFSARDGRSGQELWLRGLGRARTNDERKQVAKVAAEWADGDSVVTITGTVSIFFAAKTATGRILERRQFSILKIVTGLKKDSAFNA